MTTRAGSTALRSVLIEPQSLRSHALYFFIQRIRLFIKRRVFRFRFAFTQLFEGFLNGEFRGFSHDNPSIQDTPKSAPLAVANRSASRPKCARIPTRQFRSG